MPNAPLRGAICIVFVIFESVFGHFEKTAKNYFWVSFWSILKFWKNQCSSWLWLPQTTGFNTLSRKVLIPIGLDPEKKFKELSKFSVFFTGTSVKHRNAKKAKRKLQNSDSVSEGKMIGKQGISRISIFSETSNGRLPLEHGSHGHQTSGKRVSDDSQRFILRRHKNCSIKHFDWKFNFLQFSRGFGGAGSKRTSKSTSASNFAQDTVYSLQFSR